MEEINKERIDHCPVEDAELQGIHEIRNAFTLLPPGNSARTFNPQEFRNILLLKPHRPTVLAKRIRDAPIYLVIHFLILKSA